MAKNKDDLDTDFDDELDFGDDIDFDFGDEVEQPPKTTREAVTRTLKDTGVSFKDSFTDDISGTATKIVNDALPDSVSSEVEKTS